MTVRHENERFEGRERCCSDEFHIVPNRCDRLSLRDFITITMDGAAGIALSHRLLPIMAGPFEENEYLKIIPINKRLNAACISSLTARGGPTAVTDPQALEHIGMPVGGICTGTLYLGSDGRLWDVFNHIVFSGQYAESFVLKELYDFGTMELTLLDSSPNDPASASISRPGYFQQQVNDATSPLIDKLVGSLGRKVSLEPGQQQTVAFVITWHLPNLSLAGKSNVGRYYAARFANAQMLCEQVVLPVIPVEVLSYLGIIRIAA